MRCDAGKIRIPTALSFFVKEGKTGYLKTLNTPFVSRFS
jgi:hypothetical protein